MSSLDMSIHGALTPAGAILFLARWEVLRWTVPAMLAAWAVSAVSGIAQGGLIFAPEALAFKFERFNPATKIQQMFSITSLSALLKSLAPVICVVYLAYGAFGRRWAEVVQSSNLDVGSITRLTLSLILEIGWKSLAVLLVLSGIDYLLTWHKHESDLKMSREELREEMKESDGHPTIKARIRRLQRQVVHRQMLLETEKATVVVTNPTHFAVALQYQTDMPAPVIVAKGMDKLALEIRDVARWNNIPIMENPPLAQALYRVAAVGQEIPAKLYTAVAEILAVVYRAQAQARQGMRPQESR